MSYTLKELGSSELASMYQEYLALTDRLAAGELGALEALELVEKLEVTDRYDTRWKVDPHSGTLVTVDPNGRVESGADPRRFHPVDPGSSPAVGIVPEYEYAPDLVDPASVAAPQPRWLKWVVAAGVMVALGLGFGGGYYTAIQALPDPDAEVVEIPRPKFPEDGPSPEHIKQTLSQLSSGDLDRVQYVAPKERDPQRLAWAVGVLGSLSDTGHQMSEIRDMEGVSVFQVVNSQNEVVLQGDLTWVQSTGGRWVLEEVPLMGPSESSPVTSEEGDLPEGVA